MIEEHHQKNFDVLLRAAANGDLALVECTDKETSESVVVLCAISYMPDGQAQIVPFAKLFNRIPFEELDPPDGATTARGADRPMAGQLLLLDATGKEVKHNGDN